MLYLDDLGRYEDYIITIKTSVGNITGIYTIDTLDFSSSALLSPPSATDAENFLKGLAAGAVSKVGGEFAAEKIRRSGSVLSQSNGWQGGSPLLLSLNFSVFRRPSKGIGTVSSYSEVMDILSKLTQTVSNPRDPLQLPGYYDPVAFNKAILLNDASELESQLITVRIGRWFKCKYLLCNGVNFRFSSRVDDQHQPLFLTVGINFETYRPLTADELASVVVS